MVKVCTRPKAAMATVIAFVLTILVVYTSKRFALTSTFRNPTISAVRRGTAAAAAQRSMTAHRRLNDSRCPSRHFEGVVLVIVFNNPFYINIPKLKLMYDHIFRELYFCGKAVKDAPSEVHDMDIKGKSIAEGFFGYSCMAEAIRDKPGRKGYLYVNDDMILNWWNLGSFNLSRFWQGSANTRFVQEAYSKKKYGGWLGWVYNYQIPCGKAYDDILNRANNSGQPDKEIYATALRTYLENGKGMPRCGEGYSDFFYVPGHMSYASMRILDIYRTHKVFLEVAVPNLLRTLSAEADIEHVDGLYLPEIGVMNSKNPIAFWPHYNLDLTFIHPYKMAVPSAAKINNAIYNIIISYGKSEAKRRCASRLVSSKSHLTMLS